MFRTIPHNLPPSLEDIEALKRARLRMADRLALQAHRERAIVAGTATHDMLDAALQDRQLSRVLAGPVPLYKSKS